MRLAYIHYCYQDVILRFVDCEEMNSQNENRENYE